MNTKDVLKVYWGKLGDFNISLSSNSIQSC